jgi:hypothetical protein
MGQGEDHVSIRDRQQLFGSFGEPLLARTAVALGAVSTTARSIFDHLMRAVVALLHELAQCGGAACADVPEGFPLLRRQPVSPAVEELLPVLSEDIGDFQPMFVPLLRPSSLQGSTGLSWSASKGLRMAFSRCSDTRRYRAVV